MTSEKHDEIILYDLASLKKACFSPSVWRVRLLLNYKKISYKTVILEFPDIEPTLEQLGVSPNIDGKHRYTVPTIQHIPSGKYVMNSAEIMDFLETAYPDPPFQLISEFGREVELKVRKASGKAFYRSILPREVLILSPKSQEYFRKTRESELGHPLEALLEPAGVEDEMWASAEEERVAVGELLRTNHTEGPFVLGAKPSGTDFFIAGALQNARMVDEGVFHRIASTPGYKDIYMACLPWMEKDT